MDLLNQTLSDALPLDVATIKAESCLYRIERDIGAYFRTETSAMVAAPGKKIKRTKKKDGDTDMVDRGFWGSRQINHDLKLLCIHRNNIPQKLEI